MRLRPCADRARWFKAHADAVLEKLSGVVGGAQLVGRLGELLAGAIDFYATQDAHVGRRQRAPFWERIRGRLRLGSRGGVSG